MNLPSSTQLWAIAAGAIIVITLTIWWMQPAHAGDRFAFAGLGICIGGEEGPKYQCKPYFKPDRCNPAVGNWLNASDQTCPPDAARFHDETYTGGSRHKYDNES